MSKQTFPIDSSNLEEVRQHIRQQFENLSWWPTQGPMQAKNEFENMQSRADTLVEWCERWLDGSQWRHLKISVQQMAAQKAKG